MAWWIHDHLPYSELCFYSINAAFNIRWYERPERKIKSFATPKGLLTKSDWENQSGDHSSEYPDFPDTEALLPKSARNPGIGSVLRVSLNSWEAERMIRATGSHGRGTGGPVQQMDERWVPNGRAPSG